MTAGALGRRRPIIEGSRSSKPARAKWILALGLSMLCCRPAGPTRDSPDSRFSSSLDQLVALAGESGVRLSRSGWAERPTERPESLGFGLSGAVERVRLAGEVERELDVLPDLQRLHPYGLYRAVQGDLEEAIEYLDAASLHAQDQADIWSDLGAVHLLRYERDGRAGDLFQALANTDRALDLDPLNPSALFNRAETLTRLSLIDQGSRAWDDFLAVEPTGPWAEEAERARDGLTAPSLVERWEEARKATLDSWRLSHEVSSERVTELPHHFRMWIFEQILPEFADAYRKNELDRAANHLELARAVADRIAEATGDQLLVDAIDSTDQVVRVGNGVDLTTLLAALSEFGGGVRDYERQNLERAKGRFRMARTRLQGLGNPLWGAAAYYLAVVDSRDAIHSLKGLVEVLEGLPIERYPQLRGFCLSMLGNLEATTGDSEEALSRYEHARIVLDQSARDIAATVLYPSLGDARRLLGQNDESWSVYLEGLEAASRSGDRKRYGVALYVVAEALLEEGSAESALAIGEEMVANAIRSQLPSVRAEAYLQRGRARLALGMVDEGISDLDQGLESSISIDGDTLRKRVGATMELARAERAIPTAPREALVTLDNLLAQRLDAGYLYRLPRLLVARSHAYDALGDLDRCEEDLDAAIEHLDRLRRETQEPGNRRALFAQSRELYEEMIRFQLDRRGSEVRAFEYAEHGRARELGEALGRSLGIDSEERFRPLSLREIQFRLPHDVVVLEYTALEDRLLVWIFSSTELELRLEPIPRGELTRAAFSLINGIDRRAPEKTIRRDSATLYQYLVGDVLDRFPAGTSLVMVPDRYLNNVPFSALLDPRTDRYLIEDHLVTHSPSATVFAELLDRSERRQAASGSVMAVGNPWVTARLYPRLEHLPQTASEARALYEIFPSGILLVGREATKKAVLDELPRHSVAYLATHALVDPARPEDSALILSGHDKTSTQLTAKEILGLDLSQVELVILPVCEAIQRTDHSEEGLTGLASALLGAGVSSVIAPARPVSSRSAEWLLDLARAVADGEDVGTAFKRTQMRAARELNGGEWSSFRLIGTARTSRKDS